MPMDANTVAKEAREKYQESLKTLKNFIADFPAITKRVEEHDNRLAVLETRFSALRHEISAVIAESNRVARGLAAKRPSLDRGNDTKRPSLEKSPDTTRSCSTSNDLVLETRRLSMERRVNVIDTVETMEVESAKTDSQEPGVARDSVVSTASSAVSGVSETWDGNSESASTRSQPSEPASQMSRVTFAHIDVLEEVHRYSFQEHADVFPVHGHWLPTELTSKRKSFEEARDWAKQLGGRLMHIPTGMDDIESIDCAVVEPMGKILSPTEYVSTGLVLCLDGAEHETETLEEWGEVLKATKFLDAGLSFALPNVSNFAYVDDLEKAVDAILKHLGSTSCILMGKGWGAKIATEMAGRSRLGEKIDGIVLIAPESPAPDECSNIEVPVMLVWAEDDEESPFSEIYQWNGMFKELSAPTFIKDLATGGHSVPKLLKQGDVAGQVLHFVVSALLMMLLCQAVEKVRGSDPIRLDDHIARLCDELPNFLVAQVGGDVELGVANCLTSVSNDPSRMKRRMTNLGRVLRGWIAEGMVEMASATE